VWGCLAKVFLLELERENIGLKPLILCLLVMPKIVLHIDSCH